MNGSKSKVQRGSIKGASISDPNTKEKTAGPVAFALGGLAGNNAHGAGFLAAALEKGLKPDMISCTSGQIYWVYHYLRCLKEEGNTNEPDLRSTMQTEVENAEPSPFQDVNFAEIALMGRPGISEPARVEFIADWWRNAADCAGHIFEDWQRHQKPFFVRRLMDVPAGRLLKPEFTPNFYEMIAQMLQSSEIGIAFNSYNPAEGCEHVYLNQRARDLIDSDSHHHQPGQRSTLSDRRIYDDISSRAVRRGIWVYWYGFEKGNSHLDGAYFRQIMLTELTWAKTIYVVRPLHYHWSGDMPRSWTGMEDLTTKMNFNGTYMGERCQIELINKLVDEKKVSPEKYHKIKLQEIEMDQERGFFGYAFEDLKVFDEAYAKSMVELPGPRPHPVQVSDDADTLAHPPMHDPVTASANLMFRSADWWMQMAQGFTKAWGIFPGA